MGIKHDTVGTQLTQAEWEAADSHHITDLIPEADDTYDLGSASLNWQDLFLKGNIALTNAGTISTTAGALTITSAAAATWSTSAGALTINGTAGINLQEGGSTIIGISDARVISVGADDAGFDVIFYGDTASANMTWDTSVDDLILNGAARIVVPEGQLVLGSTPVSSTAAELNLLDGVSGLVQADFTKLAAVDATSTELNLMDGGSSIGTTTVSDGHGIVMNHGGTMAQTTVQTLAAYLDDEITAMPNLTSVGTLTTLTIDNIIINGTNIGHTSDTDAIAIASDGVVTMNQIPVFSAGINVSGGSIAGTLSTAAQANITSLGTLTTLTVDNIITNGTTIGHTSDTDLMTLADGLLTVAGEVSMTTLDIGGTNVGSTAAELNLLDGSAKSTSSITIADTDAFVIIDGTTTKQIPASDIKTYATTSVNATTVTITDNESTNEDNAIIFTAGGDVDGGNLGLESDGTLTYNPSTGKITATGFIGALTGDVTGDVTGNVSGTAATVTTAAQSNITSLGTLTTLTVDNVIINGTTIGHTSDTDLLTLTSANLAIAGAMSATTGTFSGVLKTDDTTNATSTTDGSLQTDGGLSVVLDAVFGDDVTLITDSAVLNLGVGSDVKLTHDGDTGGTLSGTPIVIDSLGASALDDDTYTGIVLNFIANGTIAIGNAVYVHTADGRVAKARANASGTMPCIGVAVSGASDGGAVKILTHGIYNDSDGFGSDLTEGAIMYVDDDTAGLVTETIPDADDEFVQRVGIAVGPRDVFVNPSLDVIERAA